MEKNQHYIGLVFLIGILSVLLYFRYNPIIKAQPHQVISAYGEGLKTYTSVRFHAEHDSGYTRFTGMAYPFEEHVIPAGTVPLLSNGIKFISTHVIDITSYSNQIIHFSILISFLLCGVFLYLIFRLFNIPPVYCAIVAIILTFLSPQTVRISSHFALTHSYVTPLTIYFLILFEKKKTWLISIALSLIVIFTAQIHFYYLALTIFVILLFHLFSL